VQYQIYARNQGVAQNQQTKWQHAYIGQARITQPTKLNNPVTEEGQIEPGQV
jgi:hypothetical protein